MVRARQLTIVALIASGTGLLGVTGCSRERVPLPAADATPQEVVRAYVRAINADDCASMRALSDPANSVEAWCGGITVSNLVIREPLEDTCCGPGEKHPQVVNLPVQFRLKGADASMPDGEHAWGYILVRDNDAERWRVASGGAG